MLQDLGHAVLEMVFSGKEAFKRVEENNIDLLLIDIDLQGEMDGIEAAHEIRSRFNIPIVYLTAYGDKRNLVVILGKPGLFTPNV